MDKFEYSPIVISGPSGSGKSVLIEYIEKQNPLFLEATGSTTRQKREIETGRMYFISKQEFELLIQTGRLIEYCIYNGNYYGVSKDEFNKKKIVNVLKDCYDNNLYNSSDLLEISKDTDLEIEVNNYINKDLFEKDYDIFE